MSAEHRLNGTGGAALFGKHPGHGDFLSCGLPDGLGRLLSDWLGATLGEVSALLDGQWDRLQTGTVALRFWIGGAITGEGPWRGVMRMSGDRVGRRYPLLILQGTQPASLPLVEPDQGFYLVAEAVLAGLLAQPALEMAGVGQLLSARLSSYRPDAAMPSEHMFWAVRPGTGIEQLCAELALADLLAGAGSRSYWWYVSEAVPQSAFLAQNGLPVARALAWLIGAGGAKPDAASDQAAVAEVGQGAERGPAGGGHE